MTQIMFLLFACLCACRVGAVQFLNEPFSFDVAPKGEGLFRGQGPERGEVGYASGLKPCDYARADARQLAQFQIMQCMSQLMT